MPVFPEIPRRDFLKTAAAGLSATALGGWGAVAAPERSPRTILLRSGWQTVNIGDVTHTPGVLRLIETHLPGTQVILWPGRKLDRGVEPMLQRAFPELRIIEESPSDRVLEEVSNAADLYIWGSGPFIGVSGLRKWSERTGKPYGAYGDTFSSKITDEVRETLSGASFLFTRETASLARLEEGDVDCPEMAFGPDGTFAFQLTDDEKALRFMKAGGLDEDEFICVIPRLRKTPYYKIYPNNAGWSDERIRETDALNEKWAEIDHAKAREAMIRWVRETGHKVLVCPEMTYQLDIMDELLIDPLPSDVKPHVVKRENFWLPDEAASVYKRARAVLSFECHSPIIAFAQGTPAFYLRQPEDTIKGQMWYDIGATDWVFEIEETTGRQIADRLMQVHEQHDEALAYLGKAMDLVHERQKKTMEIVGRVPHAS